MEPVEKFYTVLGKFFLTAIILGAFGVGIYFFYQGGLFNNLLPQKPQAVATTGPTETIVGQTPAATPATKTITAGLDKSSGLSFTKYTIQIPEGWADSHTYTNEGTPVDTLTLTKGAHKIKIFQAATGGAPCLYPGDPSPEGPSSSYDNFVQITTSDGLSMRRSGTNIASGSTSGFTLCMYGSGSFGAPTVFGHISFTTPLTPDAATLTQMDSMIASLKKI